RGMAGSPHGSRPTERHSAAHESGFTQGKQQLQQRQPARTRSGRHAADGRLGGALAPAVLGPICASGQVGQACRHLADPSSADGLPTLWRLFIFSLGAFLMRGVGCCFNDIFDRDFDNKVERTRFRPLTSGQLSLRQALWFVFAQLVLCALLLLAINEYSRWMA